MTRKDFELIARVVSEMWDTTERQSIARAFAKELAHTNARFDRDRFLRACKATPETLFEEWKPSHAHQ